MKLPFATSLYWKCQLAGWTAAALYWSYTGTAGVAVNYGQLAVDFMGDLLIGIVITHVYRSIAIRNHWPQLALKTLLPHIAIAVLILGLLFSVLTTLKLYAARLYFGGNTGYPFFSFVENNWLILFSTGVRLMCIWLLAFHLYHYAQREIKVVKENARLQLITREAQMNRLSAQLNPHFFFNSLNNIKFLVGENPESARRAIDLLSDLLRNSLYSKNDQLIPLQQELDLVKDYLELEKLRFEERLQINISVEEALMRTLVPPLCIQTLVENAIKHGIDSIKAGGCIDIQVTKQPGGLLINVQNPGKLNCIRQPAGLGLKNLRERLALQYNGQAMLELTTHSNHQVLAKLAIPTA